MAANLELLPRPAGRDAQPNVDKITECCVNNAEQRFLVPTTDVRLFLRSFLKVLIIFSSLNSLQENRFDWNSNNHPKCKVEKTKWYMTIIEEKACHFSQIETTILGSGYGSIRSFRFIQRNMFKRPLNCPGLDCHT